MLQDLRYACRTLARNRAYASASVVTLALGLGVNTGVATVAWSVLLRPLPITDPNRVVFIYPANPSLERLRQAISFQKFKEWRARNPVFQELGATMPFALRVSGIDGDDVAAAAVSDNFLGLLGVRPAEGRLLDTADRYGTDGAVACVISAPFARRMFGATSALNRRFDAPSPELPNVRVTLIVVGVMPNGFERWRDRTDMWVPAEAPGLLSTQTLSTAGYLFFEAVGRLRPGVTAVEARAAMEQLDRDVDRDLEGSRSPPPPPLRMVTLRNDVVPADLQRTLWLFAAAALLVLVIAAANASSLVLARLETRHPEVLIRKALGASPAELFRSVFAETMVLAAIAAVAGVPLAYWSLRLLGAFAPAGISGQVVAFSPAVAAFTLLLTLGTATALAGLQHLSLRGARGDSMLHGSSASTTPQSSRTLDLLVIIEVAISVVVVAAGGLLVRNLVRLQHVDPGFEPSAVLALTCDLEDLRLADEVKIDHDRRVASLLGTILERAVGVPGVAVAALGRSAPLDGTPLGRVSIRHDDGSRFLNGDPRDSDKTPDWHWITPRYFAALGIPLRAGRVFTEDDEGSQTPVVIVNETMAKLHWPWESAVGKRVKYGGMLNTSPWAVVIGVVGDVRSKSLHDPPRPELYVPLNQLSAIGGRIKIFLKTRRDPVALAPAAFAVIHDANPRLRVLRIEALQDVVSFSLREQQYQAELIGAFASLALILASVGVYGLLNYTVTRRRREMAIRLALGATSHDVASLVFRHGATLVIPGAVTGMVLTFTTTRVMRSLLYGISTTDPMTFVLVPSLFVALAVVAGIVPTFRAASVDPALTLRED